MSDALKLSNQICFPFYALSRNIIKRYTPFLQHLDLTYPQYLVMMILWEKDEILIKDICDRLWLETNTVSPLIKNLEAKGFIERKQKSWNKKEVLVLVTNKWKNLEKQAQEIPEKLLESVDMNSQELQNLHKNLWKLMKQFEK